MNTDINSLRETIRSIISVLLAEEPFFGLLLKRTWIMASDKVPTAMTDGIRIYVNPQFFEKLQPQEKKAILLHELMHVVQLHPTRSKKYIKQGVPHVIVNMVADAKANQYIEKHIKKLKAITPIMPHDIERVFEISDVEKKSFEEIMDEILKKQCCDRGKDKGDTPPIPDLPVDDGDYGETKPLNEGDESDNDKKSLEEIERQILKKLLESAMTAKQIGRLPAELERLVDEIAKPKVHWKRLLRSVLAKGLGKSVKRTWSRPSRKIPNSYPGKETLKVGTVVVLVDTSGSIGQKELRQFVGEIYAIAKEVAKVVVIPWDAKAYEPIVMKSYRDIEKVRVGLKGGGGTIIRPALELVDKKYNDAERIVILSDWYIGDLDDPETQRLLKKYADRIIAVTTSAEPPSYLMRVKIDLSE